MDFSNQRLYELNDTVPVCAEVCETLCRTRTQNSLTQFKAVWEQIWKLTKVYKSAGKPDKVAFICKLRENIPLAHTVSMQALNWPTYLDFQNQ